MLAWEERTFMSKIFHQTPGLYYEDIVHGIKSVGEKLCSSMSSWVYAFALGRTGWLSIHQDLNSAYHVS